MVLPPDELDALLRFLDRQWMPPAVQRAYDRLVAERYSRQAAETRLSDLEQRLRAAAAQPRPMTPDPGEDTAAPGVEPDPAKDVA